MKEILKIKTLLNSVKTILKHQDELEKVRGEKFNVFSILKMERKENETHSAFLGELLNIKGSHLKGPVFLKLFLDTVGQEKNISFDFDINSSQLTLEKFVGKRNDDEKIGGRIDIYLIDRNRCSISIENKIDAIDQFAQIERYVKHNKDKNTVLYLNLFGDPPSNKSIGENLKIDETFFVISYKETIIKWLNLCLEKSYDSPILRESIKQYILLIKKNTFTMETKNQNELLELMMTNFNESEYISKNFYKSINIFNEQIRQLVLIELEKRLNEEFNVWSGNDTSYKYSQIWLGIKGYEEKDVYFGFESFSAESECDFFIGVFVTNGRKCAYNSQIDKPFLNKWWPKGLFIDGYESIEMNLKNSETLTYLMKNPSNRAYFAAHLVTEITKFIKSEKEDLIHFYNSEIN